MEKEFDNIGIKPNIYEAFGGIFDFSESSNLSYLDRQILIRGASDLKIVQDYNKRNDYRDWVQIQDFCRKFAEMVLK